MSITLFLCGDVMTGRGIDQILPHPNKPNIYEPYMRSALGYVELAERVSGPIPRPVDFAYIWGDALEELERMAPEGRIVNLETAVTSREDPWPGKGIHYRMHPKNIPCLTAAGIDACALANNHVLDWGFGGLLDTLDALHRAGIATAGAGKDTQEAALPAALAIEGKGRVLVFAYGLEDSGIPPGWAARRDRPGINFLPDLSRESLERVVSSIEAEKRPGDIAVVSLHWGGNWGFEIDPAQRDFAHGLIERGADVIHGHSSHHVKGIEVYEDRPIFYGCGDFLNDYEGIGDFESYRGDLTLMYFPTLDREGRLERLALVPMQIRRFRLNRAPEEGIRWLMETLDREGRALGTRVEREGQRLRLLWR